MRRRRHKRKNKGKTITDKGYVRVTAGPYRHWYEHRVVMAQMCSEFCYYQEPGKLTVPAGFVVHHMDHDKKHNCRSNLLLLQAVIHNNCIGIPTDKLPWEQGQKPWEGPAPDWVTGEGGDSDAVSWEADR